MSLSCFVKPQQASIPLYLVTQRDWSQWYKQQDDTIQQWLKALGFAAKPNTWILIPSEQGSVKKVIVGVSEYDDVFAVGGLPLTLPNGTYHFQDNEHDSILNWLIGWGLGSYQFTRYKKSERTAAQIVVPKTCDLKQLENIVTACYCVRDLINTPTEDMGPAHLAQVVRNLADEFDGDFAEVVGDELLAQGYAAIHTVGRASVHAPRLLDLRFGNELAPRVTLVGKGVCFDSGGLDIKPDTGMLLMKKDMGGAAHVLALARMILVAKIPVRLRVLIPAVENSIAGNAYRPGDVIKMRAGITVEVNNTDAEGRLILADALNAAIEERPDLLIDIATLTGAARVAVGTEIASFFVNDEAVAQALAIHSQQTKDPMWRLPLHTPYRELLKSQIADLSNSAVTSYAGAITAALFLQEFVPNDISWVHIDTMAWNISQKPGRPIGGEANGLRALFSYLQNRYL